MANLTQELGWSTGRVNAVQEAASRSIARTAKCRRVIPKGPQMIGHKSVPVPQIANIAPLQYGTDIVATPIHIWVDVDIDDQHINDEQAVIDLIEASGAQLGRLEDEEIIQGNSIAAPAANAPWGQQLRNNALRRFQFNAKPNPAAVTNIAAAARRPTGLELLTAITTSKDALEGAGRPGECGLLLHNSLYGILGLPLVAGAPPLIHQVEEIIEGNQMTGTSALDGTFNAGQTAAILFRLEPHAVDLVHTMLPTVTFLGRSNGQTHAN